MSYRIALACCIATATCAPASAQIRVVTYNMLDKPANLAEPIAGHIRTIFGVMAGKSYNGVAKRPDLLVLQEQAPTSPALLASILNSQFGVSSYVAVVPGSQASFNNVGFVYDSSTLNVAVAPIALPISQTGGVNNYSRPTIRIGVRPVGYTSSDATMYVYGLHTMAGNTPDAAAQRDLQLIDTRANADALGTNKNILYAGDFNFYTSTEAAYQRMIAAGNAQATDPLGPTAQTGNWHNNASFAWLHTQSTRLNTLPDNNGSGGGVDDRLDQLITSNALLGGEGLSYIGPTSAGATGTVHSYHPLGNNGTTFNKAINDPSNTAEPANVLESLYQVSDHLPVFADLQLPAKLGVTHGPAPVGRVIAGAALTQQTTIRNDAPATSVYGADELDYNVTLTGLPSLTGTIRATQAAQTRTFTLDTATPGDRALTLNVSTTSRGAQASANSTAINYTVLDHAQPSLSGATIATSATLDLGIVAIGTSLAEGVSIWNLPGVAGTALTAGLDVDDVSFSGDASFSSDFAAPKKNIIADSAAPVQITVTPAGPGLVSATLTLATSDEDMPGAASRSTLSVHLSARGAIAGDATLSDTVDFNDLLVLAQHYGQASDQSWTTGDFTRDGSVGFDDLLALAQHYGDSLAGDWALAQALVPEPGAMVGLLAFARRRRSRSHRHRDLTHPRDVHAQ